jgi:hypothetical protein
MNVIAAIVGIYKSGALISLHGGLYDGDDNDNDAPLGAPATDILASILVIAPVSTTSRCHCYNHYHVHAYNRRLHHT